MLKRFPVFAVFAVLMVAGYLFFEKSIPGQTEKQIQNQTVNQTPRDTFVLNYEIREGDSLSLIAHRFGIKTDELANANTIKDGVIYAGEILSVPLDRRAIVFVHNVSEGETLSSLSEFYGTSVDSIMRLNHMKDDAIFASHKILVSKSPDINSRFVVFKVGNSDTESEISRAFGMSMKEIEKLNTSNPGWLSPGSHILVDTFEYEYSERTKERIIETAKAYLGAPYKYGGNSTETGIDCSAYVKKVFSFFGVNLPRTVRWMHKHADGVWVERNRLEKGDLVFFETNRPFPSHIGIYIENGKFIHASSAGGKVLISDLNQPYYSETYIGSKRIYLKNHGMVAFEN